MTEGGTIQRPELRARDWSRKMRRQFLPYQLGEVDAHVFDLVTVVQAEALPEWQAKKSCNRRKCREIRHRKLPRERCDEHTDYVVLSMCANSSLRLALDIQ
jgi:hypothetical protein